MTKAYLQEKEEKLSQAIDLIEYSPIIEYLPSILPEIKITQSVCKGFEGNFTSDVEIKDQLKDFYISFHSRIFTDVKLTDSIKINQNLFEYKFTADRLISTGKPSYD